MTSTLLAVPSEDDMIDGYRPRIMYESREVNQVDNPGEFPQALSEPRGSLLPDPSVGGQAASGKDRIGWSTGLVGLRQRRQALTGLIFTAPQTKAEPVQGNVGRGTHANQLQAGVKSQMTQYDGSLSANVLTFVGSVA